MRLATPAALLAALGLAACALHHGWTWPSLLRLGPDRTSVPYDDPRAADKQALFERLNRDRLRHGVPALAYEPRGALVGDQFCLDAALSGASGHWDLQGRAPYVRWGLAGGVDYHAQNTASWTANAGRFDRSVRDLLLEGHESMMAETPPDDGHRQLILDPTFTHVGIGLALVGGQFRVSEEFTRVGFEWISLPPGPLPHRAAAAVAGRPLPGWQVGLVEVRFEPPPRPLTLLDLRARHSYGYPRLLRSFHPYQGADALELRSGGEVWLRFALDAGPGYYFVLHYLRRPHDRGDTMVPATAVMVTAVP